MEPECKQSGFDKTARFGGSSLIRSDLSANSLIPRLLRRFQTLRDALELERPIGPTFPLFYGDSHGQEAETAR